MKALKLFIYRILSTRLGRNILDFLSFGISVKNLGFDIKKTSKSKPFIVVITIDTESGYTKDNEERIWQRKKPDAFIGFYKGIENWRSLFNKYNVKASFFVSTQCFDARGTEAKKILQQLTLLKKEVHEIGLHIHPDSDLAVQKLLSKKLKHTSAKFYDYKTKKEILKASKFLLMRNSKLNNITSFRWGNWGIDTESVKILQELDFKVDTSAVPGINGHLNDGMFYDWSNTSNHYPWFLSTDNYQDTELQNSRILELPIATFDFFGIKLRADPVNFQLLNKAFDFYYKNAARDEKPFVFVVISHSPEATYANGSKTKVVNTMENFINHAKKFHDVKFMTLGQASYFFAAKTK